MPAPADVYSDRDSAPDMPSESEASEDSESKNDESDESDEKGDDKDSESATGLLSKSMFSGKDIKPGYKCSIVVDKIYDDQVSIRLASHSKSDDSDDESEAKEESVYD